MSDEAKSDAGGEREQGAGGEAASTEVVAAEAVGAEAATAEAPVPERRDADGLPLDREPTLDDVRSESGSGRSIAWGCTALVVAVLAGFWVVRAFLLG